MGKLNAANIKKTYYYLKRNGFKETWYAAVERLWGEDESTVKYKPRFISEEEWKRQREWASDQTLFFSIAAPTYRTDPGFLKEMIDSVRGQSYGHWELILADATEDESVKAIADAYEDDRIVYLKLEENKGISENTNAAVRVAKGDFIGLLDHDDILEPNALYEMAQAVLEKKKEEIDAKLLYSDEDKCTRDRKHYYEPNFKEKFNLDLILSNNYICHFMMMESSLMKRLELRKQFDGAQDYDLVLRAVSEMKNREAAVVHIPKVLYHWRCHESSTAENPQSKLYAYEAGRRALQDFADRNGYEAEAVSLKHLGFYKLIYKGDIFENRKDLGAAGGRIVRNHRIVGGCMDGNGKVLFGGLKEYQSGYLHRASLMQDTDALDIRCIRISSRYRGLFEKITGVQYTEDQEGLFDFQKLPMDTDYRALSLRVCRSIRDDGAGILYWPDDTRRLDHTETQGNHNGGAHCCKTRMRRENERHRGIRTMADAAKRQKADNCSQKLSFEGMNQYPQKPPCKDKGHFSDGDNDKITVVIPNYNGLKYLRDCMDSLEAEREEPGTPAFRILVVDNHSTDGSEILLRENWPDAEKIYLKENTGFCHAVNLGIRRSGTPYVILLNNDTKIKPGFIKYLYQSIAKRKKAFSVSAQMLMWDDPELVDDAGDYYTVLGWACARGKGKSRQLYEKKAEVFSACAGAAIYRKEVFERIGIFDERHFAYLEDLDIGYRARIYGYRNYYEPNAMVIHYGSASTGSRYNEKKTVLAAENNVYVIFKNMPLFQRLLNLPFLFAGFLIKFLFFCRKRMGLLYLKGLWRGLKKSLNKEGRARRICFQAGNFKNYLEIQMELYWNILRIFINSIK